MIYNNQGGFVKKDLETKKRILNYLVHIKKKLKCNRLYANGSNKIKRISDKTTSLVQQPNAIDAKPSNVVKKLFNKIKRVVIWAYLSSPEKIKLDKITHMIKRQRKWKGIWVSHWHSSSFSQAVALTLTEKAKNRRKTK